MLVSVLPFAGLARADLAFSLAVDGTEGKASLVVSSEEMTSRTEDGDAIVWTGHPLMGRDFSVRAEGRGAEQERQWRFSFSNRPGSLLSAVDVQTHQSDVAVRLFREWRGMSSGLVCGPLGWACLEDGSGRCAIPGRYRRKGHVQVLVRQGRLVSDRGAVRSATGNRCANVRMRHETAVVGP